jgi:hypothetical protein
MTRQSLQRFSGTKLPDPHRAVAATASSQFPVGTDRNAENSVSVALETVDQLGIRNAPHADRAVQTGRQQALFVGGEADTIDAIRVTFVFPYDRATGRR